LGHHLLVSFSSSGVCMTFVSLFGIAVS
jgi:hypothetical protein